MARNDVYLNINALSPADAVVTGQQDMTAATVPELVLGDTPTFNFYFTDNTNVWPSWAGNAAYTVTWALSDAVSGDFSPAATTGNATPITGGWSVVLPLNAYDLVGLLNTKRVSQPYPVTNLWQQIRVADPSGNEVTRAMFWTPVRYRAISDTQNTESASPTGGREVTVDNVNVLTTPTAAQFYAANPVPTSALGSAANGELLIGNGTGFTKSTLTAGTGITVTNGSGSITIDASGAQETLTATVKNAESVAITKGQVVYLFGATGNMPSVKLAYNTSDATSAKTFGVVSDTSISPNGTGTVTCVGVVDGMNLGAYQDGDTLYLGATPGSITATKPYAPNHLVYVGIIERANAGNGELYVRVQNGYELDEIHDVQINSPRQSGQTLIYDNTTSLWKNARITAGSNIAVTNGDGSISIGFSGTLPVANGGTGVTTSTGSGSVVLSTSPTLTTPILGTPQSGTLSSCTGLPISTGVSGLGTNVATFLATPSSANLASAVTDETGTGALVFANTPTLTTPNIGAATGTSVNLSGAGTFGGNLTVSGTGNSSVAGNLGIGETSPVVPLHVKTTGTGTGDFDNAIATLRSTAAGRTITLQFSDTTNQSYISSKSGALNFGVGGATLGMSLSSSGNLTVNGTGTSSFGGKIQSSAASATGYNQLYDTTGITTGRGAFAITSTGAGLALGIEASVGGTSFTGSTAYASYFGTTTATPIHFVTNAAISATLTSGGNVLIGTTTDRSNRLHLAAAGPSYIGMGQLTSTYAGIVFGDVTLADSASGFNIAGNAANSNLVFNVNTGGSMNWRVGNANAFTLSSGSNLLIGTTTDSANGKLQLATHTTSAGGIGFGTDTALFRSAAGALQLETSATAVFEIDGGAGNTRGVVIQAAGTEQAAITVAASGTSLLLSTGSPRTTALTLDASQNATFAALVKTKLAFEAYDGATADRWQLYTYTDKTFRWNYNGSGSDELSIDTSGNLIVAGSMRTGTPTGGTASAWKFGKYNTTAPSATGYVEVDIGGTLYKLLAST